MHTSRTAARAAFVGFVRALAALALLVAGTAGAQVQRTFVNLGFELPSAAPSTCFFQVGESAVPGWTTNHPSQNGTACAPNIPQTPGPLIEIWTGGFSSVPARFGNQFAELNAEAASRIFQNVCLATGEPIGWRFSHRGRQSATVSDVMEFRVGSTAGTNRVIRAATQNDGGIDAPTCYGTSTADGSVSTNTCNDAAATGGWHDYSGQFTWTGATGVQAIGFEAISAAGGTTIGNFLDDIQVTLRPFVELTSATVAAREGTSDALPALRVVGTVPAGGISVQLAINGGTAQRGIDYTTASGTDTISVTVPAGVYDGTNFPLPMALVDDAAIEDDETITLAITSSPTNYVLSSTQTCGGTAITATTVTIGDNDIDLRAALAASVANARAGDTIGYTLVFTNNTAKPTNNAASHDAVAPVSATPATGLTFTAWTCTATGGASCPIGSTTGSGAITGSVTLPAGNAAAGGQVSYAITATIDPAHCTAITQAASITTPAPLAEGTSVQAGFTTPAPGGSVDNAASANVAVRCNSAPVAQAATASTGVGSVAITLHATDADDDPLTYRVTTPPAHGTLSGMAPALTYTPNAGYVGDDTFAFVANDGTTDSAPATITVSVSALNHPPVITSMPLQFVNERSSYAYDVDATDPDAGDAVTYSLPHAPAGMSIEAVSGNVTWPANTSAVAPNLASNSACLQPASAVPAQGAVAADIVFVVDESGSMDGAQAWLRDISGPFETYLRLHDIGAGQVPNRYGVVGFTGDARSVPVEGTTMGGYAGLPAAFESLLASGGGEEGWKAIRFATGSYPLRSVTAHNVVLVTDEGRDPPDMSITYDSMLSDLQNRRISLNAVVTADFLCGDGSPAFGLSSDGIGYKMDGQGGYTICTNAVATVGNGDTVESYVRLALASGGAAWDFRRMRQGGVIVQPFVDALFAVKVQEILQQMPPLAQADLYVRDLRAKDGSALIEVGNRGLAAVTQPMTVSLSLDGTTVATVTVASLAPGEVVSRTLTFDAAANPQQVIARIEAPAGVAECATDNNELAAAWTRVEAVDLGGLEATQGYSIVVRDVNDAPLIDTTNLPPASVGLAYQFRVSAHDPDRGDTLSYSLGAHPVGMMIDAVTGTLRFRPETSQLGTHPVVVKASDLSGTTASATLTLVVDDDYIPPRFTSAPDRRAVQGTTWRYATSVAATPGLALQYDTVIGPPGLAIDASGVATWNAPPDFAGKTHPVTLRVRDSYGRYDLQTFNLFGDTPNVAPRITSTPPRQVTVGTGTRYLPAAQDANYQEDLIWRRLDGPAAITVNATGGEWTWPSPLTVAAPGGLKAANPLCRSIDPAAQPFVSRERWALTSVFDVGQPVIGQLGDTNLDGHVDGSDIVAVIAISARDTTANKPAVKAYDVDTGDVLWRYDTRAADPAVAPAMADLVGTGDTTVLFVDSTRTLVALRADGALRWVAAAPIDSVSLRGNAISVADLDRDGRAEILVGPHVYDAEGRLRWSFPTTSNGDSSPPLAVDLDGDGRQEVLYRGETRRADGTLSWKLPDIVANDVVLRAYYSTIAIAGASRPGLAVSVATSQSFRVMVLAADGTLLWQKRNPAVTSDGPLLVADVADAPGQEIFLAATGQLFSSAGDELWRVQADRWPTFTGRAATALDIDGDGAMDIVATGYIALATGGLSIVSGQSGGILMQTGALPPTYPGVVPLIADPRGTGNPILVLIGSRGLSVLQPALGNWATTARAVHQWGYAADRIGIDMRVPAAVVGGMPAPLHVLGGARAGAIAPVFQPDLRIGGAYGSTEAAATNLVLRTDVVNRGTGRSRPYAVGFYRGNGTAAADQLARIDMPALLPGAAATVVTPALDAASLGNADIATRLITANDEIECNLANNVATTPVMRIAVTDHGGLEATQAFTLAADQPVVAPVFGSSAPVTATENVAYRYAATATTPTIGDVVTYSLAAAPVGAFVHPYTGEVAWTPRWGQVGRFSFELRATGLGNVAASQTWSVTVAASTDLNTPPRFVSTPLDVASVGYVYRYAAQAVDDEGHEVRYSLTGAPSGMRIDPATGAIAWIPATANPNSVSYSIIAKDARNASTTQPVTVRVFATPNRPPRITSTPPLNAAPGTSYAYTANAIDPDGDPLIVTWRTLPDGATGTGNALAWTPRTDQVGEHAVAVDVRDGRGGEAQQAFPVFVNTAGNAQPVITSTAPTAAVVAQTYTYSVVATDADDAVLGYRLTDKPSGMSINASTGAIAWTPAPSQVGTHAVTVLVTDGRGGAARQTYSVRVDADPAGNRAPVVTSLPPLSGKTGSAYRYDLVATDADNDPLTYTLDQAPAGMQIASNGRIDWMPATLGDYPVLVKVSDGTVQTSHGWTLHVGDPAPLSVRVIATPDSVTVDESVTVQVIPQNAAGQVTASLELDGVPVSLAPDLTATVRSTVLGEHTLFATAGDGTETASDSTTFEVRDAAGPDDPVVTLITPTDDARVTAPAVIRGTVTDTDLASWRVLAVDRNGGAARQIANGTTAVNAGTLGTFDPTLLLNGQYTLILEATDAAGHRATDAVVVTVDGDMKLGHYSITFEEATVPLAGIPIQITRTYDTRRAHESLDFGHGWTVDASNVRVHESRRLGFGWGLYEYRNGIFSNWCVQPNGDPIVTVTLPDGDVQRFKAKASPECQMFVPTTDVQIAFEPLDGTTSQLEQLDYANVRLIGNQITELDQFETPIDPGRYRLTTREGVAYEVDQSLGLRLVSEPNGQTLTYTRDGIRHSSGVGIDFVRDTQGRIVRIELPDDTAYEYRYTASGDLDRVIDPLVHDTRFAYAAPNHPHYLKDITDARGIRVNRNEYDAEGRLVATIDADNNRIEYTHELANRIERVKDRRGNTTTYAFDDNGWVLTETNARNESTKRTYDTNGNVLTVTDPRNKVTTMTYDARGNVLTEKNPLNETTTSTYNESNQLLTQKDNANRVVATNTYDERAKSLLTTKDALNNVTTFTYDIGFGSDATGELTSMTDALGRKTTYELNLLGWRTAEVDADGHRTGYVHDLVGRVKTETRERTDATGTHTLVTTYTYDDKGRLTSTEHPDGSTTTTTYNAIDKPEQQCDAQNRCTTTDYDARGNETAQHYPDGTSETKTYDANGNLATETDREGRTTKYEYDEANRLVTTRYPDATPNDDTDNPTSVNVYDTAGRLSSTTNPRGYATTYGYDDAGRTTSVKDVLNNTTTTVYDTAGRRLSVTDALSRKTSFVYDAAGKVTQTLLPDATPTNDNDNPRTTIDYDALGRKVAETDPAGRITRFAYDKLGRLERVVLANPQSGANPALVNGESPAGSGTLTTRYTYDELGNKRTQVDALNHVTTWTYDNAGRVLTRTLPLGQVETFQYDSLGRRTQFTDFRGRVTTYTYRPNTDWLATIDYATQTDVALTYTPGGQIEQVTDGNGITAYTYDERGRLDSVTWPNGLAIAYDYDANGNRTSLATAQQSIAYTFDELDRLKTVTPRLGGGASYTYDAVGNRKTVTHANGVATTYTYNERNHLTNLQHKKASGQALQNLTYQVDTTGLRNSISDAVTGYINIYTYDKLKRLTQDSRTSVGTRTLTWTYDAVGNRQTEVRSTPSASTTYTYDANDRLTQGVVTGAGAGTTTYTYDDAGNLTRKAGPTGIESYTYNDANQLAELTALNGEVTRYAYNHNGIRISQTNDATGVNPVTQHYLVDPNQAYAQVIEEHEQRGSGTKTLSALYTFGDDRISQYRPAAGATPAATRHYHADGLGSIRLLTDPAAGVTDKYNYDAFGELDTTSLVASDNEFRYTGEQVDPNSGFYYLRARYMNPANGRFTQQDSFAGFEHDPRSIQKYVYGNNEPIGTTDPSGNFGLSSVVASGSISSVLAASASPSLPGKMRQLFNNAYRDTSFNYFKTLWANSHIKITRAGKFSFITIAGEVSAASREVEDDEVRAFINNVGQRWNISRDSPSGEVFVFETRLTIGKSPDTLWLRRSNLLGSTGKCRPHATRESGGNNISLCKEQNSDTASHEFGHSLGFDDMYDEDTGLPVPDHPDDIMANSRGEGSVQWYHGKVLSEHF